MTGIASRVLIAVFIFSLIKFSSICHAQYITGPVAAGAGGAGRASVEDGEQFIHNPAALVHGNTFSSALFYVDGFIDENTRDRFYGLTLSDNSEDIMASGGYAYVKRAKRVGAVSWDEDFHMFAVANKIRKYLAAGVSVKYREVDYLLLQEKEWNADFGLHFNPHQAIGLGLVVYNFLKERDAIPAAAREYDRVALASNFILLPLLRARLDVSQQTEANPDKKLDWEAGLENLAARLWIVRLGYRSDDLNDRQFFTLGLGFNGPRLKADYFYRQNTEDSALSAHGVDIRLPFW